MNIQNLKPNSIINTAYGIEDNFVTALVIDILLENKSYKLTTKFLTEINKQLYKPSKQTTYMFSLDSEGVDLVTDKPVFLKYIKTISGFDRNCFKSKDGVYICHHKSEDTWYICSKDYEPSVETKRIFIIENWEDMK